MSTVIATRVVPADPASTALLLAGPSAVDFWPGLHRTDVGRSPLHASAHLAGADERELVIRALPPQRTPTSYVTAFSVDAVGLPKASGTLRVTRQAWIGDVDQTTSATSVRFELRTDVDFDDGVEQEISAQAEGFLDNIARFATARADVA